MGLAVHLQGVLLQPTPGRQLPVLAPLSGAFGLGLVIASVVLVAALMATIGITWAVVNK